MHMQYKNLQWSGPTWLYLYSGVIRSLWQNSFSRCLAFSNVQLPWSFAFRSTSSDPKVCEKIAMHLSFFLLKCTETNLFLFYLPFSVVVIMQSPAAFWGSSFCIRKICSLISTKQQHKNKYDHANRTNVPDS